MYFSEYSDEFWKTNWKKVIRWKKKKKKKNGK